MRARCHFLCALFGLGVSVLASPPPVREVIWLAPSERNPFAKRAPKAAEKPVTASETEEGRIRAALSQLDVVGRTQGPTGWRVLLGEFILETGKELPPVIAGQTEVLKVKNISDQSVEIAWIDEDTENADGETRKMLIPIALKPTIAPVIRAPANPDSPAAPSSP